MGLASTARRNAGAAARRPEVGGAASPRPPTGRWTILLVVALGALSAPRAGAWVKATGLRCESGIEPLGIDASAPSISWRIESNERSVRQSAWQVLVASSAEELAQDRGDLWDSGRIESDTTIGIRYAGKPLLSSQQVFWKVRTWAGGEASDWSPPASWTMGLLKRSDWRGGWIAAPGATESLLVRHEFAVRPGLRRALVHVSGLGQYELYSNGRKVGDDFLAPGWTNYDTAALYDTRDVTGYLHPGANAIGLLLGNGFDLVQRRDRFTKLTCDFGPLRTIVHLRLEYADGTVEFVGSDPAWKTHPGPITTGNIYAGEDFDARLMPAGWAEAGFDDRDWSRAVALPRYAAVLRGYTGAANPLGEIEVQAPVGRQVFRDGTVVYDFGQNASHIPRIRVSGPAGSIVRLTPAEVINADGTINRNTMDGKNRGNAWWQYTKSTDGPETWQPRFYYVGCRYLKAECFRDAAELPLQVPAEDSTDRSTPAMAPRPGDPNRLPHLDSLEAVVVHSIAEPVGEFSCSNPLLNRIYGLVRWAQRSNLVSVLTDCPHREKLGWLEQYHLNGPSLRYDFAAGRIFAKAMDDMNDEQTEAGMVPNIAPEFTRFEGPFRSAAEWGAAFVLVPWQQHEFTGDTTILQAHFEAMKRYFSYLESQAQDDILSQGLGDWYDLGPKKSTGPAQLTPPAVTASAFFFEDARILAEIAKVLGRSEDAAHFASRAEQIRIDYNRHFFHPDTGTYATGSQCANALALVFGIPNESDRPRVLAALVRDLGTYEGEMTTGDIGFRFLLRALADGGRSDLIYRMIDQDERPGYGYQLKQGATSLTETWDASLNASHDHFMLGQIVEWFFHDLAGIAPDPTGPGFARVLIRPSIVGDLSWVQARYDSVHGPIFVRWERSQGRLRLNVDLPPNTTATIAVPAHAGAEISEGNTPANAASGVSFIRRDADQATIGIGSGRYRFETAW